MIEMTSNRRYGRPSVPYDQARSERVVTFLTPSEMTSLKRLADESAASLSATLHRLVVRELKVQSQKQSKSERRVDQ